MSSPRPPDQLARYSEVSAHNSLLRLRHDHLFGMVALCFLLTTATSIGPYSARFGPYYLALLLGLMLALVLVTPTRHFTPLVRRGPLLGLLAYGGVWVTTLASDSAAIAELRMAMFALLVIYTLSAVLAAILPASERWSPPLLLTLLFCCAINLFEFFVEPNLLSTAPGRAAGFFENPNNSGAQIVALTALWLVLRQARRRFLEFCILLLSVVSVVVTFSRGAIAALALMIPVVYVLRARREGTTRLAIVGILAACALVLTATIVWLSDQELSPDAVLRVESMRTASFDDESATTRMDALRDYWSRFLDSPLSGAGAFGSLLDANGQGPHNTFVALAADFGILGLAYYLAILFIGAKAAQRSPAASARAGAQVTAICWLTIASLFSHNVFYSPAGALMIGFALGSTAIPSSARWAAPKAP